MRILVTGACGFTARHLAPILPPDAEIFRLDRQPAAEGVVDADLSVYATVQQQLARIRPDQIYHLAGVFSQDFALNMAANCLAAGNILEALCRLELETRVLLIGSAAEYGWVAEEENPIREDRRLQPVSVYGLTKKMQTALATYYARQHHVRVCVARTFNLFGQGISPLLFAGRIDQQIADFKDGKIATIEMGNLASWRDYMDVRGAVRLYRFIMEHGQPGEVYNVGTGKPIAMHELLRAVLAHANVPEDVVRSQPRPAGGKPDVPKIYADMHKTKELLRQAGCDLDPATFAFA
jgi:GDP-4-dehydro-6-deoxy-D-mannose reductase